MNFSPNGNLDKSIEVDILVLSKVRLNRVNILFFGFKISTERVFSLEIIFVSLLI